MWNTNILPFITKQGIGKCNKGVFATNDGAYGQILEFVLFLIWIMVHFWYYWNFMWSHLLCYPLQIVVGMELHHKPWLEVYQKVRLLEWMVSNKLSASYHALSKLLKLSPMIKRCNENKESFQIKYECPQEFGYY
jgi:hypothetical protein